MVSKFIITIPKFTKNQFHSHFQWILTLLDRPEIQTRIQYFSNNTYEEMNNVYVNGFKFEKLIFDFESGKIHIYISKFNVEALYTIVHSLTIKTSPTSQSFCLFRINNQKKNSN